MLKIIFLLILDVSLLKFTVCEDGERDMDIEQPNLEHHEPETIVEPPYLPKNYWREEWISLRSKDDSEF